MKAVLRDDEAIDCSYREFKLVDRNSRRTQEALPKGNPLPETVLLHFRTADYHMVNLIRPVGETQVT